MFYNVAAGMYLCECRNDCSGVVGLAMYRDCRFCRDFRTCFGSYEVNHTCTSGLAYNHVTGNCFPVAEVNCGSSSRILTSSVEEGINQTTCVDDCSGRPSGNYQSCSTCHGFTTCSNGITYKMKCAVPALWYDSSVGACIAVSSTCFYAG
ncbi:uncharacterized protein LOC124271551 [Haliotis rubra]|uniref:uncharacterized protein LOC124271551 n=1 Tax=Haliotis rubra TaxID=36100 RepID=UPI001EE50354|nr:uncharacterized protein LOC124271551 [Haliotis rubra]